MMRKFIAEKLFNLALRIDGDHTTFSARALVYADDVSRALMGLPPILATKKRANWHTHTWVPGEKPAPKKRGRPLGSKNKPKGVNDGAIG
jgi:hypothetical protein